MTDILEEHIAIIFKGHADRDYQCTDDLAALGCVHTNRVESSPIQSSQTLESWGVHTDRVESNQSAQVPVGF